MMGQCCAGMMWLGGFIWLLGLVLLVSLIGLMLIAIGWLRRRHESGRPQP